MNYQFSDPKLVLLGAFRHSLQTGEFSYYVVKDLIRNWSSIRKHNQESIHEEIKEAIHDGDIEDGEIENLWAQVLEIAIQEYEEKEFDFEYPRESLMSAFRYSLGRRTYMPSVISIELRNNWDVIGNEDKLKIKEEIMEAISKQRAGDNCDIVEWEKVVNMEIKR